MHEECTVASMVQISKLLTNYRLTSWWIAKFKIHESTCARE